MKLSKRNIIKIKKQTNQGNLKETNKVKLHTPPPQKNSSNFPHCQK